MVTLGLDDEADRNRYDIMESFEALDTQKTGYLDFDVAYTLLLGLGYMSDYKKKDDFSVTTLKEAAKRIERVQNENYDGAQYGSGIDLETLLAVVDTHPALSKGNQSESFASKCFKLLDRDNKGYATASDIQTLGNEVGLVDRKDKLSTSEGTEIVNTTTKIFGEGTTKVHKGRLQPSVFQKLFEPSSH